MTEVIKNYCKFKLFFKQLRKYIEEYIISNKNVGSLLFHLENFDTNISTFECNLDDIEGIKNLEIENFVDIKFIKLNIDNFNKIISKENKNINLLYAKLEIANNKSFETLNFDHVNQVALDIEEYFQNLLDKNFFIDLIKGLCSLNLKKSNKNLYISIYFEEGSDHDKLIIMKTLSLGFEENLLDNIKQIYDCNEKSYQKWQIEIEESEKISDDEEEKDIKMKETSGGDKEKDTDMEMKEAKNKREDDNNKKDDIKERSPKRRKLSVFKNFPVFPVIQETVSRW